MSNRAFSRGYVRARPVKGHGECWQLDWRDSETGARMQRRVRAATVHEAREMAEHFNREVVAGRGLVSAKGRFNPSVDQAMQEAIAASRGNVKTLSDYTYCANLFGKWLNDARAGVVSWRDVSTKLVKDYLNHCAGLGLSNDAIRKRLYVVKMTSHYMAETYSDDFSDVARVVRFVRVAVNPHTVATREQAKALPADALIAFLDHLQARRSDLHAIACLQGLAGMRAMEAANVREGDIDFQAGTVRVDETPHHRPKTQASFRTIPVAPRCLLALRVVIDGLKVRHPHGYLFATVRGDVPWTPESYSHAMRRELLACWQATGLDQLRAFQGHWLRATFVSLVRARRVDHRILQVYIGHAPGDTMGRFYERIGMDQLREIAMAAALYQSATVKSCDENVNAEIAER